MGRVSIGEQAAQLGHTIEIERLPRPSKRFRMACSCGAHSSAAMTRVHQFQWATQHAFDVVQLHGRLEDDDVDEDGGVKVPFHR